MRYNLIALLCALSLTTCVAVGLNAGTFIPDYDMDGWHDDEDNCNEQFNYEQNDEDGDGYGQICDRDLDNSGKVNVTDFGDFKAAYLQQDGDSVDDCISGYEAGPPEVPGVPWNCCTGEGEGTCLYNPAANFDCSEPGTGGKVTVIDFGIFMAAYSGSPGPAGVDVANLDCDGDEECTEDCCDKNPCTFDEDSIQIDVTPGQHMVKNEDTDLEVSMWIPEDHINNVDIGIIRLTPSRQAGTNIVVRECTEAFQRCDGANGSPNWMVDQDEDEPFYTWACSCRRTTPEDGYPDYDWTIELHMGTPYGQMIDSDMADEYYREFRPILNIPVSMGNPPSTATPQVEWNCDPSGDETEAMFGVWSFVDGTPPTSTKVQDVQCAQRNPVVTVTDY